MLITKQQHKKTSDRQFYQFVQSFPEDTTLTADRVHQLGLEFVAKQFPNFEVLISTHCNTDNLHNHILVNSVSFETGKKLHQNHDDLVQHRMVNDELCMKFGDTPLQKYQKSQRSKGMSPREYRSAMKGESWKMKLINTIDDCMKYATSKAMFIELMESEGYKIQWSDTRKYITYTTEQGQKCRDHRLHEDKYLKENMENEFRIREKIILGRTQTAQQTTRGTDTITTITTGNIATVGVDNRGVAVSEQSAVQLVPNRTSDIGQAERDAEPLHSERADEEIRYDDTGIADIEQDIVTGWEQERESLFYAEIPIAQTKLEFGSDTTNLGIGDIVATTMGVATATDAILNDEPVAPKKVYTTDKKALAKTKQRKLHKVIKLMTTKNNRILK